MKKTKVILMVIVVITAVSGAFAAKKKFDCYDQAQYYLDNGVYKYAGIWGVNWWCDSQPTSACSFIQSAPGVYTMCRTGHYVPINPSR